MLKIQYNAFFYYIHPLSQLLLHLLTHPTPSFSFYYHILVINPLSSVSVGQFSPGVGSALECGWCTGFHSTEEIHRSFYHHKSNISSSPVRDGIMLTYHPPCWDFFLAWSCTSILTAVPTHCMWVHMHIVLPCYFWKTVFH